MIRAGRPTAAAVLFVEIAAVSCQFIQHTDQRFPLLYFTVDSALLAAAAAATALIRPHYRHLAALQSTSAVAVVLSALIFASVIAPSAPTGTWIQPHDDYWARTATVLMHGVAPVLVCIAAPRLRLHRWLRYAYLWPVTYLAALTTVVALGWAEIPYPFLRPSLIGWGPVGAVIAALALAVAAVSGVLSTISLLLSRPAITANA